MQPNHYDLLGQVQPDPRTPARMTRGRNQPLRENAVQSRRAPGVVPPGRSEDSWIEVSSQPSSSSMSSNNDDIITTGLRVQQSGPNVYHRHRNLRNVTSAPSGYSSRETGSSQDEYEESESEEDRVLSSSNEEMNRQPTVNPLLSQTRAGQGGGGSAAAASSSDGDNDDDDDDDDGDDDDNSTALGTQINASRFVPQPNVFSDPHIARNPSWTRATEPRRSGPSEVSNSSRRTTIPRNSQASLRSSRFRQRQQQHQQHSPYNMISPSHHADHDAALRASLSTLLSCAAAARGLPKPDQPQQQQRQQSSPGPSRERQSSFRLVPESVAMGEGESEDGSAPAATAGPQPRKHGPSYLDHAATPASKKRRSSSPRTRSSSHPNSSRKSRRSDSLIANNPTVMTWVLSAGAVVLFSAISFSAGYMLGREVGRMEVDAGMGPGLGDGGLAGDAVSRQQAVKGGLKKLRWGSSAGSGILA